MEKVDIDPIQPKKEEQEQEETKQVDPQKENKNVAMVALIIFGSFALLFAGFKIYNATNPEPVTIEEYHQANYEGNLDEEKGYVYNGFSFVRVDSLWWTDIVRENEIYRLPLHFGPRDVENITITGKLDSSFDKGDTVFISIDPDVQDKFYTLAVSELSTNVAQGIGRIPQGTCTKEAPVCANRTILTCETANGRPVIEFKLESPARIELQDSCITLYGEEYELIKATNRLLLLWYRIIDQR